MIFEKKKVKITSVKSFVEEITRFRTDVPEINAEQWFFRGQKNAAWDVRPNIFRGDKLFSEHTVLERAQRQNHIEFRECDNKFEILTKTQHYGLGTRLLDVTLNPLVALFFATEPSEEFVKNKNGQYTQLKHDGRVYYKFTAGCSLQDIQIRIAMAIPFVEFGKSMSLDKFCTSLKDDNTVSLNEYYKLVEDDYSEMVRLLQTNSFMIAANSNIRLIQQRGAFLISPSININTFTEVKTSLLAKAKMNLEKEFGGSFIIPAAKKEKIREELDFFNVNEATLFPELEHQMNYIQSQSIVQGGIVDEYLQYGRERYSPPSRGSNKSISDISDVVQSSLLNANEEFISEIIETIGQSVQAVDWQKKESVISHIRRVVAKKLSGIYSAIDAKRKANEIVDKLLN